MLQVYHRNKGRTDFDPKLLEFSEPYKLDKVTKIHLPVYDQNRKWSLAMAPFGIKRISVKNERYFVKTKYRRVIDQINQLVPAVAKHLFDNREKYGITKTEEELQTLLKKDSFQCRTFYDRVFYDGDTRKPIDLKALNERGTSFKIMVSVKPTIYIADDGNIFIDLELMRATIYPNASKMEKQPEPVAAAVATN